MVDSVAAKGVEKIGNRRRPLRAVVGEGDDRGCEQEAGPGDEVLGHVDVAGHEVFRRVVEDATELPGHARTEELGHLARPYDGRVFRCTHGPDATGAHGPPVDD